MGAFTESMGKLIDEFAKLPGIGRRTAERLAYHVLDSRKEGAIELALAIRDVVRKTKECGVCFNAAEGERCSICADSRRDHSVIWVVEDVKDLIALEKTGQVEGVYHVLKGRISPMAGKGPEELTIDKLLQRVRKGKVKEIVLATNPDLEGDMTAQFIIDKLKGTSVGVSRIARGIAQGSSLEYASKAILEDAIAGRQEVEK